MASLLPLSRFSLTYYMPDTLRGRGQDRHRLRAETTQLCWNLYKKEEEPRHHPLRKNLLKLATLHPTKPKQIPMKRIRKISKIVDSSIHAAAIAVCKARTIVNNAEIL